MVTEIRERSLSPANNSGNGRSVSLVPPSLENEWPFPSFQIVSLFEMIRFYAGVFQVAFLTLGHFEREFRDLCDKGQGEMPLDEAMLEKFRSVTKIALDEAEKVQFQKALDRRANCEMYAQLKMLTYNSAYHELKELREALHQELYKRPMLVLTEEEGSYFNKMHPFGQSVYDNFESARGDIREACNCYALGRPTACVFHLTRALEAGLKALASYIGATFTDINAENWEGVITGIEGEIKRIRQGPRGSQKAADLEFYSGAAKQFRYFKEHWRNPVDHFRGKYDGPQALSALGHVEEFMRSIAARGIKE